MNITIDNLRCGTLLNNHKIAYYPLLTFQKISMHKNSTRAILNSLVIYKLSKSAAIDIYCLIKKLPKEERFNIGDQIRRSSISIGANIAEGYQRKSSKDTYRFLTISRASLAETIFLLEMCEELGYVDRQESEEVHQQLETLDTKIYNFAASLK